MMGAGQKWGSTGVSEGSLRRLRNDRLLEHWGGVSGVSRWGETWEMEVFYAGPGISSERPTEHEKRADRF